MNKEEKEVKEGAVELQKELEEHNISKYERYLSVQRLLDFINNKNNIFGRSLTYPKGWIKVKDLLELIKKYET